MGRLSSFTRLALGRAGLGEPIKDEDGNFVVNAHAFDNDSRDYVQKFTGRGHPSNPATNKAKKRLDRAQNEVLEIVGVVRSRHEQILQRRPEHGLSDRQLAEVVESEHDFGILIRAVFPALLDMSSWWILIHRTRLTTFRTAAEPGLMAILRREVRPAGFSAMFTSGLWYHLAADELRDAREYLALRAYEIILSAFDRDREPSKFAITLSWVLSNVSDAIFFGVEWSIRTFSILQCLGMLPHSQVLSWKALLPFVGTSLVQLPRLPSAWTPKDVFPFAAATITSPVVLAYFCDGIRRAHEANLVAHTKEYVFRPNNPDELSESIAKEQPQTYLRPGLDFQQRNLRGPHFRESLRRSFPAIARILDIFRVRSPSTSDAIWQNNIKQAAKLKYARLVREDMDAPDHLRHSDEHLRILALSQALADAQVESVGSEVNIREWADEISTATPDPDDLFVNNPLIGSDEPRQRRQSVHRLNANSFVPVLPLDHLLAPLGSVDEDADLPELPVTQPILGPLSAPPTPVPGLSRAPSLSQAPSRPTSRPPAAPRPVRRPTELDEDISAIASSLQQEHQRQPQRSSRRPDRTRGSPHRVTALSAFPADALSYFVGTFITSVLMLPLDVYVFRRVAMAFASSSDNMSSATAATVKDIMPLRPTLGIFSTNTLILGCNLAAAYALEGTVKTLVWSTCARLALWSGRGLFMWGAA